MSVRPPITFYEYSGYSYGEEELRTDFDFLNSPQEVKYLDSLSRTLAPEGAIFSISQTEIRATHYVGCLSFNGRHIEILPKLLKARSGNKETILRNLLFMLSYTHQLDVTDAEAANLSTVKDGFLEVYISLFSERLLRLLKRQTPRRYTETEENLSFVKGKLLLVPQLKFNSTNRGRAYCRFDEFTEDNLISQTLKFVSSQLIRLTSSWRSRKSLKQIVSLLADVQSRTVQYEDVAQISLSRANREFISVFNIAKMFLSKLRSPQSGGKNQVIAILFNMNDLFEEFFVQLLRDSKEAFGLVEVECQKGRRLITGIRNMDGESEFVSKSLMNTFTDIMLTFPEGRLILDTKYKLLDESGANHFNISNGDVYQILAYSAIHVEGGIRPKIGLVYPENNVRFSKEFRTANPSQTFFATTINLHSDLRTQLTVVVSDLCSVFRSLGFGLGSGVALADLHGT